MKNKLPVYIDDMELPYDNFSEEYNYRKSSYGYVSVLNLISILITLGSVITVINFLVGE